MKPVTPAMLLMPFVRKGRKDKQPSPTIEPVEKGYMGGGLQDMQRQLSALEKGTLVEILLKPTTFICDGHTRVTGLYLDVPPKGTLAVCGYIAKAGESLNLSASNNTFSSPLYEKPVPLSVAWDTIRGYRTL